MDSSTITLHSQARDLLFKHYQVISRIFRDVIGQFEIDYISIALLTPNTELLFFSSRPSVDWNIIERDQWLSDSRFKYDFIHNGQPEVWNDNLRPAEFYVGLSVPSTLNDLHVVYTFASKSKKHSTQLKIMNSPELLRKMGKFCLINILNELPLLNLLQNKPELTLVINNNRVVA